MHWCKGGLCCAAIFVEAAVGAGGASDLGTVVRDKQVCHRCIAAKVDDAALRSVEAAVGVDDRA